jgi:hypothetical protein
MSEDTAVWTRQETARKLIGLAIYVLLLAWAYHDNRRLESSDFVIAMLIWAFVFALGWRFVYPFVFGTGYALIFGQGRLGHFVHSRLRQNPEPSAAPPPTGEVRIAVRVVMPKLSEAMETGTIIRWLKQEGDRVRDGDILAAVQTDKAGATIEAFGSGVLRKILVPAGSQAPVGALIAVIAEPGADIASLLAPAPPAGETTKPIEHPVLTNALLGLDADTRARAYLPYADRTRHLYVVGQTGSGKTTLLQNLIHQHLALGHAVGLIAPEAELFRDQILPLVPEKHAEDVIYFAPGDPKCPLTFNPLATEDGDDQARAAGELFSIFHRAIGEEATLGPRMTPILRNLFLTFTGRPGATLADLQRFLTRDDGDYRAEIVATLDDEHLRAFWHDTYERYPKDADLPILNRLDQFLASPALRKALCHPVSSFSIRDALRDGLILFLDLSRLAPGDMLILGQMLLAKFQLELLRREEQPQEAREPYYLFADEFQTFAGTAEETWGQLLSRGRRYGLALTLAHQHPSQLPTGLQAEILGNIHSLVAFSVSARDAGALRKEFLHTPLEYDKTQRWRVRTHAENLLVDERYTLWYEELDAKGQLKHSRELVTVASRGHLRAHLPPTAVRVAENGGEVYRLPIRTEPEPIPVEWLQNQQTGSAIARFGRRNAFRLRTLGPPKKLPAGRAEHVRSVSWERYQPPPASEPQRDASRDDGRSEPSAAGGRERKRRRVENPEDFLE